MPLAALGERLYKMAHSVSDNILTKITRLYGPQSAGPLAEKIADLIDRYPSLHRPTTDQLSVAKHRSTTEPCSATEYRSTTSDFFDERDCLLITYADNLQHPGQTPLECLGQFCRHRLKGLINIIHILPFFPYSSDDGFSVIDYRRVNPDHGDWSDIGSLAEDFDLCFDLVLNHVSAASHYFKGFLAGVPEYRDFFIELEPDTDTSAVLRPRTLPLLHRYDSPAGPRWCWTTFSDDQVDFNFANPDVLLELLDILLFYVARGARVIRLDAIAYLWKQLGTSCAHLPQTHLVVQIMRDLLAIVAARVLLLTETNVPHADNISYFGDGANEAQVVYNFPLSPLVLHTILTGNARHLTNWARTIVPPSRQCTFLNFTASHDGIGVRPAADILSATEFQHLVETVRRHGGRVSFKNDADGNAIPYELNINYFDALNDPHDTEADQQDRIDRFMLSQSIALVIVGIPAIYIHSLLGSRGWPAGVAQTGRARSINREKLLLGPLEQQLSEPASRQARIFQRYCNMLRCRRMCSAFHPHAGQTILDLGTQFFVVRRRADDNNQVVLAVHNVTARPQPLEITPQLFDMDGPVGLQDLLSGEDFSADPAESCRITVQPYQYFWLKTAIR